MAKAPSTKTDNNAYFLPTLTTRSTYQAWSTIRTNHSSGLSKKAGELLAEISPIDDYTGGKLSLRFKDYHFDDPKLTEAEARENNVSYEAPLKANVELTNKVTGEVKEQEIYLGDYPWMTSRGTFVINGAERVVVSQLIRSAGVFFTADQHGATSSVWCQGYPWPWCLAGI